MGFAHVRWISLDDILHFYLCSALGQIMEEKVKTITCVVLAGGLGTRLQRVVHEVVKPMAPMGHKPFLHVLLDHLYDQGISNFVLALGHKSQSVTDYFDALYLPYAVNYSFEHEPLGTGGALKKALDKVESEDVVVLNGDTFFGISWRDFLIDAAQSGANFFMALKSASGADRYGNVALDGQVIQSFSASGATSQFQNGGIYWLKRDWFRQQSENEKFSLELDFFPKVLTSGTIAGKYYDGFFIDIGVPEDYHRAKELLSTFFIDKSWTLFLDRDGVINERVVGDYIKNVEDFHFIPGALEAIVDMSLRFGRVVVVTNQQGIGKGLMTPGNLEEIHRYMCAEIERFGGRIDAVYHAPNLAQENSPMRKPDTGMAFLAKQDFPEINFKRSVMIGDSDSDIAFGESLGMITVKLDAPEKSSSNPTLRRKDLAACVAIFESKTDKK